MAEGVGRGHSPRLIRETVARTVLEVGFPQLTFTTVQERLGAGESTLFRYASNCDELVRLGLGLATESVEMPPQQESWRQVLTSYVVFARHFWETHPGSATEVSRGVFTLVMVRLSDELCFSLTECGSTTRNTLLTCDLVFDMTVDSCRKVEHMDGLSVEISPECDDVKR